MRNAIIAVVAVLVIVVGFFVYQAEFDNSGNEFCPQTFEVRHFNYKTALVRWDSYGMDRAPAVQIPGPAITDHLITANSNAQLNRKRWDLVEGNTQWSAKQGAAKILVDLLNLSHSGSSWDLQTWSQTHNALAAELWPRVQTLAIHNLYFSIPELVDLALAGPSVADFVQTADRLLIDAAEIRLKVLLGTETSDERKWELKHLADFVEQLRTSKPSLLTPERLQQIDAYLSKSHELTASLPPEPPASDEGTDDKVGDQ